MTVVTDSSPLIILSKIDCFDVLKELFSHLYISVEVHDEVVIAGAGLPGASQVAKADWIEVKRLRNQADLVAAQQKYALGLGELSTILLAKQVQADAVLLDNYSARKLARAEGLQVRGSLGLLEISYVRGTSRIFVKYFIGCFHIAISINGCLIFGWSRWGFLPCEVLRP